MIRSLDIFYKSTKNIINITGDKKGWLPIMLNRKSCFEIWFKDILFSLYTIIIGTIFRCINICISSNIISYSNLYSF